ncbi:ABC transporter ATP-binding protein [Desulfotalea psychrophila]|uniref:Probable sugar ABC transporter, ATP-binding protein n=1 Tax=Desulfotalea psychrophila (strain LSv54 / DSM 12343) TaxID=177439 RepID=Q6AQG3_DESPS|nr:ABC transporter ATP-binding protein [Desulfotalea psychrophila]CAG35410.1 probable sugar ABC transporter, ATP-binding protein [Desulfotalea psychrophila LSv54]
MTSSAIRLENISKSFGDVHANRDVSLDIRKGRVLALLGENGAGKSTLMSILAGQLQPDSGTLYVEGEAVVFSTTEKAIGAGVGMVYQHFKLVEAMTVAENIILGRKGSFLLNKAAMYRDVQDLANQYGMDVDPRAKVHTLAMGEKQQVEILKLLFRQSNILIFDEPTAVLTPTEAEGLFVAIKRMTELGKGIVFISHKLEEVMRIADDVAILRRGEVVDTLLVEDVSSTADLAERMVGKAVLLEVNRQPLEPRQTVLRVDNLQDEVLKGVSIDLRKGEILGIVGVAGNGQKQLIETICGLKKPRLADSVSLFGLHWKEFFSNRSWDHALSYIPEDRQGLATCRDLDLVDNFLLTTREGFTNGPFLDRAAAAEKLEHLVELFDIRPPNIHALAWHLSGGNLQKMVLAREFYRKPRLIVAEQPTQGLDISAAEEVWNLLLKTREQAGVLLVTGDLSEALALSDRIAVMCGGEVIGTFSVDDTEQVDRIPQMMAGIKQ